MLKYLCDLNPFHNNFHTNIAYKGGHSMKIVVLERNSVGTDVDVSCLEKFGEVVCYPNTVADVTAERIKDADVVICNKAPMNETTMKSAPNIKLICLFATGYDNVDIAYCKSRGIKVANVVNYCTAMVAQHTLLLALALTEKLVHYDQYTARRTASPISTGYSTTWRA